MKKIVRLTESDLERIVRRVIEEQYAGVAFGAEQNGLKFNKIETKEQQQIVLHTFLESLLQLSLRQELVLFLHYDKTPGSRSA